MKLSINTSNQPELSRPLIPCELNYFVNRGLRIFFVPATLISLLLVPNSVCCVVAESAPEEQTRSVESESENAEEVENVDLLHPDEDIFEQLLTFQKLLEENDDTEDKYSEEKRCIDTRRMRHYDVLSARFIAFEMRQSDEFYLVQFEKQCPGLQKNGNLTFDIQSGQSGRLCVNDSIEPLDTDLSTQTALRGGSCRIPSIEKITEVQLIQLERGLASNRVE